MVDRALGIGCSQFGYVTRPPLRIVLGARSVASPPAVIRSASKPFGANSREDEDDDNIE